MAKTREQIMNKYNRNMSGASQSYKDGVANPSKDWATNYVNSAPRMIRGLQEAIANNVPQNAVRKLGTEGWKQATLSKADRFATAVPTAVQNYGAVVDKVIQAGESARQAAASLPGETLEQRLQRVPAAVHAIRNTWGKS